MSATKPVVISKKAALDAQKSANELETNEEYASIEAEIGNIRARIDARRDDILDEDFERVFREPI